ncbi:hypothetical protein [Lacisediminihabitans changchengi]|uniref:Uncharacterized protein n=1 Tax=Lacisediminihabitans changchengi TaxID=2787634 RepID=A0A934SMK2_9MICO|nr:hypothetical protein [Lacisediminihabitans changchengi]MBK4348283.1 hypothetical protein [Lacisediminihabitans changchengi]
MSLSRDWDRIWIRAKLDRPLPAGAAPLRISLHVSGRGENDLLEFGITVARGELRRYFVIDHGAPHVHELDGDGFAMGETVIVAPFDAHWLASVSPPLEIGALLTYDAMTDQGEVPVSVLNELR